MTVEGYRRDAAPATLVITGLVPETGNDGGGCGRDAAPYPPVITGLVPVIQRKEPAKPSLLGCSRNKSESVQAIR
jgi:hypothetical protein